MINCETKYIISDDMYMRCKKFAEDSVLSSADKYARRQQFDIEKISDDSPRELFIGILSTTIAT